MGARCVATLSSLCYFYQVEVGGLNRWMHIWPYKDLSERERVREEARQSPHWPTGAGVRISQENKILVPATFSPMH